MTEAEIAEIRARLEGIEGPRDDDMFALLAHIDALRDNLYLEQLEGDRELHAIVTERDALAAEVERLTQVSNYYFETQKSLRDLVREARQLIGDSHPAAKTWLEKAAKA